MMNGICGGILVARAGVDTATISTPRRAARGSQCPSTPGVVLAAETVGRAALIGWRFHGGHHMALQIPREVNPLDHAVFQVVFGGIMTVLIALEFGHALQYFFSRGRGIIQAKIVIVIALLAIARKV